MDANINEYHNNAVLKILITSGANIEKKNEHSETVLYRSCKNGKSDIVRLLLKAGANPNSMSTYDTCLTTAASRGYGKIVEVLITNGADVNLSDVFRITPLMYAASSGHIKIVKFLIRAGADLNIRDFWGNSALFFTLKDDLIEITELLIEAGADLTLKNEYGDTVYDLAKQDKRTEFIDLIKEKLTIRFDPITITAGMKGSRIRRKPNTETVYNLRQAYEFLESVKKESSVIMRFANENDEYEFVSIQEALAWLKKSFE